MCGIISFPTSAKDHALWDFINEEMRQAQVDSVDRALDARDARNEEARRVYRELTFDEYIEVQSGRLPANEIRWWSYGKKMNHYQMYLQLFACMASELPLCLLRRREV